MVELEDVYHQQLLIKIKENLELKLKIEKLEQQLEEYKKYKNFCKFFEKFKAEYENTYTALEKICSYFELIKEIFKKRLLLNPNFSNIKLSIDEKTDMIYKCRNILLNSEKVKIPQHKDFNIGYPKNYIFPDSERNQKKAYVVKKNK